MAKWDRYLILAALHREGITLRGLAELYQITLSGVRSIWTRPNEPAERAIADFLGEPVEELFPDRYPKTRHRILKPHYLSETSRGKPGSASPRARSAA